MAINRVDSYLPGWFGNAVRGGANERRQYAFARLYVVRHIVERSQRPLLYRRLSRETGRAFFFLRLAHRLSPPQCCECCVCVPLLVRTNRRRRRRHPKQFFSLASLSSDICLQFIPSAMADREDNVYKAKLAEQAERYDGKFCLHL